MHCANANQWSLVVMLLLILIKTATLSTTGAQKVATMKKSKAQGQVGLLYGPLVGHSCRKINSI